MVKHVSELISCQSKVAEKGLSWNQTTPLDDDGCLSECMGVASEDAVGESLVGEKEEEEEEGEEETDARRDGVESTQWTPRNIARAPNSPSGLVEFADISFALPPQKSVLIRIEWALPK